MRWPSSDILLAVLATWCFQVFGVGRVYLFRVPEDAELVDYLNKFAKERGIRVGLVSGIGALKSCTLGFYNQKQQKYEYVKIDEEVELSGLQGNVSIRESEPFVHVHAVVGRRDGSTLSGHLVEARVFVAEVSLVELVGERELRREREKGLWLWKSET